MKTVRTARGVYTGRRCQHLSEHPVSFWESLCSWNEACPAGRSALLPSLHSSRHTRQDNPHRRGGWFPRLQWELTFSIFWSKKVLVGRMRSLHGRKFFGGAPGLKWIATDQTHVLWLPSGPSHVVVLVSYFLAECKGRPYVPFRPPPLQNHQYISLPNFYQCISLVSYCFTNPKTQQIYSKGDHSIFKVLSDICMSFAWMN